MQPFPTLTTTMPHLDTLLGGGIPRGATALIVGVPGSGKTTLACQIIFDLVEAGKKALIFTTLSESTGSLIAHLRSYPFFRDEHLGGALQVLSLRQFLTGDLATAQTDIVQIARRHQADVILLDRMHSLMTSRPPPTRHANSFTLSAPTSRPAGSRPS
ncbi:MAG: AAA family ATPase [Ktedonobacterales bacterium]|nr:AAA family ATPase [Ktedonobacterales bacterium]